MYWNLREERFSILGTRGRVIGYADTLEIEGASFVVRPAGRARTLREGRKNVHAFVRGTLVSVNQAVPTHGARVSYNPYYAGHFYLSQDKRPVRGAPRVYLHEKYAYLAGAHVD